MAWPLTEADIARLVERAKQAPPLTPEQRARLRPILRGTLPAPAAEPQAA